MLTANSNSRRATRYLLQLVWLTATLALALAAAGAVPVSAQEEAGPTDFPRTVVDATGREVPMSHAPERIISLAPSVTEDLYALGLGDAVVGVIAYSNYPPEAGEKPVIGDAFALNIESIVELEPDLLVGDLQVVSRHVDMLTDLGMPVLALNPTDLEGVMEALELLGRATGAEEAAAAVVSDMRRRIGAVEDRLDGIKFVDRPSVYIEYYDEPLLTAARGSFPDELIWMAGGWNIVFDAPNPWPEWSEELVIERNPEVILLAWGDREEVMARPGWRQIAAVRSGRVYEVDPDLFSRTSPRIVDGLERMAELLHPESF